ncbi:MAG: Fic family protein [Burkholderiaceae bacterium]
MRLLCEAHRRLLDGARGAGKQPGELRRSQNWIGGTRPGNAVFVPPPPEHVPALLAAMERFIHGTATDVPPMVQVALVHAQFETIHPFLDGNGRIGRLLIAALFEHWGLLSEPLMYLSGYLKQHQAEYYRRLSAIRTEGDWESWVRFFLEGVATAAGDAEKNIIAIASLVATDRRRLLQSAKAGLGKLPAVRNAAHDAALHHRARTPATRYQRPHRHGCGQSAGRIGRRDRDDRAKEEQELQLPGLR